MDKATLWQQNGLSAKCGDGLCYRQGGVVQWEQAASVCGGAAYTASFVLPSLFHDETPRLRPTRLVARALVRHSRVSFPCCRLPEWA